MNAALEAAFWANVDVRGPDDCWEWIGSLWPNGYGKFLDLGAHRWAWNFTNGPIPEGLLVCHSCDWRPCCNPAHLFLGTHLDNAADMVAKGRHAFGERCGAARLTEAAVREIRDLYARGGVSIRQVAAMYGMSFGAIQSAICGDSWSHVR